MRTREVLEGFHFIPRGFLNGNHFVALAPGRVDLVDTAYLDGLQETLAILKKLGISPESVTNIFNTHCHCDHIGANNYLQELSGCTIHMHSNAKEIISTNDGFKGWWDYFHQKVSPFTCNTALEECDEITVGAHQFEVLHLPGHSKDLIGLYNRKNKVLLTSDALWSSDMAVITEAIEGDDAANRWLLSLEKLENLDVSEFFPGHGLSSSDLKGALAKTRARIKRFIDDPLLMGEDLLKKLTIYTLLMNGPVEEASLMPMVLKTRWFPETVARYFNGDNEKLFAKTIEALKKRGALRTRDGRIGTTVKR